MLANLVVWAALGQVGDPGQGPTILLSPDTEKALRAATRPLRMEAGPAFSICNMPGSSGRDEPRASIVFVRSATGPRMGAFGVPSLGLLPAKP